MSIQETVVKYRDVINQLTTGDLRRMVIKSEKLAQVIACSKSTVRFHHKACSGKTVIYKCIKKVLHSSITHLSSEFSSRTDILQFLRLYSAYQYQFQALSGQIKKYCRMQKYYQLKFSFIEHLEAGAQIDAPTLLRFWVISLDEFIRKEQWLNKGSEFLRFYTIMIEYSAWKWDTDSKRQHEFMCQFRIKFKECLIKFYESFDLQISSNPLEELIAPWERAVYVASHIDAFTGEQVRIDGAELFWTFKSLIFSSISSVVLQLSDLHNIFSAFQPYGRQTLVRDFARTQSLKWDKDDQVGSLIHALIRNDMFPYFNREQINTMGDGIYFLRLLRKNFQENITDVKDFHIQVMKYLNFQFKNNYNSLIKSLKIQGRNGSCPNMVAPSLNNGNKFELLLSSTDEYYHFVDNKEPLWQHKLYPKIYTNEQVPMPAASAIFDSEKKYAMISLLRYYLPENRKFFRVYYLPSIFKRILYYGTKFGELYFMEDCLERLVIESLMILEPSLVDPINNLVESSIVSLKKAALISDDKTSSSVILLPHKKFKSLWELNQGFNEPFWPNEFFSNNWPDLANMQLDAGQTLQDAFAFHLFEVELPIIVDNKKNMHLKLISNMCTTSILYLYNESDSLSLLTIQKKLAVLPSSKRNEILLNNLNRLIKRKLLLTRKDIEGQKVYSFNYNYKSTDENTAILRLI